MNLYSIIGVVLLSNSITHLCAMEPNSFQSKIAGTYNQRMLRQSLANSIPIDIPYEKLDDVTTTFKWHNPCLIHLSHCRRYCVVKNSTPFKTKISLYILQNPEYLVSFDIEGEIKDITWNDHDYLIISTDKKTYLKNTIHIANSWNGSTGLYFDKDIFGPEYEGEYAAAFENKFAVIRDGSIFLYKGGLGNHFFENEDGIVLKDINSVCAICWSERNKLISGSTEGEICIWDTETKQIISQFSTQEKKPITSLVCRTYRNYLAVVDSDNNISIWNTKTKEQLTLLPKNNDGADLSAEYWSPDSSYFIYHKNSPRYKNTVVLLDPKSEYLYRLEGHTAPITSFCWSPDSKYLATASEDNTMRIWDVRSRICIKTIKNPTSSPVTLMSWYDDHYSSFHRLLSVHQDNTIVQWNMNNIYLIYDKNRALPALMQYKIKQYIPAAYSVLNSTIKLGIAFGAGYGLSYYMNNSAELTNQEAL